MAISRVGTATGTNTATPPTHSVGDIIIFFAYRSGSTTPPSLPAGYTSILTQAGTTCAARLGFKIATATNDAGGTWTNAVATVCHVYTSSLYSTGGSIFHGGSASVTNGASLTVNYPALTMTNGGGTSWVMGAAGVNNTSQTIVTAPTGMTNESLETAAAAQAAGHDTNGTVSSWSSTNVTTTGTAGDSVSCTLEIVENAPAAWPISNIVQRSTSECENTVANNDNLNNFNKNLPNASLSGNGLVLAIAYPSGAAPNSITDNKSNSWSATPLVTADAGAGNMALSVYNLASAATGTETVTFAFSNANVGNNPIKAWLFEVCNVTGTANGTANANLNNTGGVVSPGSFTPTNNNNLILTFMSSSHFTGSTYTVPTSIMPANNFALCDAEIGWTTSGEGSAAASAAYVQGTAAAITPLFNVAGTSDTYNVCCVALSIGTQGTPQPTGQIYVAGTACFGTNSEIATWKLQVPGTGSLQVFGTTEDLSGTANQTVTDSQGNSWTLKGTAGDPLWYFEAGLSANCGRFINVHNTSTGNNLNACFYDIVGASTSPFDTFSTNGGGSINNVSSITGTPTITPSTSNGVVLVMFNNGMGATIGPTSPSGAINDYDNYEICQFTATIAATTLTESTITWGAINSGGNAIQGTGVTVGTTIQSGSGPTYTIQPSQTVSSATSMQMLNTDGNTVNWGNGLAHYYNPNTNAISWNWSFANQPSNECSANAIAFKAAPTGNTTWTPFPGHARYVTRYSVMRRG